MRSNKKRAAKEHSLYGIYYFSIILLKNQPFFIRLLKTDIFLPVLLRKQKDVPRELWRRPLILSV